MVGTTVGQKMPCRTAAPMMRIYVERVRVCEKLPNDARALVGMNTNMILRDMASARYQMPRLFRVIPAYDYSPTSEKIFFAASRIVVGEQSRT